ncbi:hypothetical protein [Streptomyces sp. NPDC059639]|uniref:hypothetical protein n=1 Tax=Streptomyces sp. NPDC059639 TaxID=3346891 RepID=UPI00367469F8
MIPADGSSGGVPGASAKTKFNSHDLDSLKDMVADARPQAVMEVSQNWVDVHDQLVGSDGSGGIKQRFDSAVQKVLESWKGSSAAKFQAEAAKISQEMATGGNRAQFTSKAMENSADSLYKIQDQVGSIDVSWWDEAWDSATDMFSNMSGAEFAAMLANPVGGAYAQYQAMNRIQNAQSSIEGDLASGMDTQAVIDKWGDSMGARREAGLKASILMEQLGNNYQSNTQQLEASDQDRDYQAPPSDVGRGPGDVSVPGSGGTNPGIAGGTGIGAGSVGTGIGGGGLGSVNSPNISTMPTHDSSISTMPASGSNPFGGGAGGGIGGGGSQINTGLDSAGSGLGGGAGGGIGAGAGAGLGAGGGIGGGAGGGIGGGAGAGLGAGGLAGGMAGGAAGAGRAAGGAGAGRAGGAAGRTGAGRGMGGMGGGAGGAGAGKGAGGAGRTGASARAKGGVVGAAKGKTGGAFTPGGTGLRNRGSSASGTGAGAGAKGQNGRNGMGPGGAGGRGAGKQRGEGGNNSRRPDYLYEDEETWTPKQRKVNPPVIE